MKAILLPSLAALLALPAFANPPKPNVEVEQTSDALSGAGIVVTFAGSSADVALVYCDWEQDGSKVRVFLEKNGSQWEGSLPACHARSKPSVVACAEDAEGRTTKSDPETYPVAENTTDARGLTNQRYPDVEEWAVFKDAQENAIIANGNLDDNWYGAKVYHDANTPQMIQLAGDITPTNVPVYQGSSAGFVRTRAKILDGVGSIWFKAKMTESDAPGGKLVVDKITSTGSGTKTRYYYHKIAEVEVPQKQGEYEWHQYHLILQDYPVATTNRAYYRIRNNTPAASSNDADLKKSAVDLCDILLTPIIPDVKIYKDGMDYEPGFPSLQDPIVFHVSVSNLYASAPAEHVTPRLVWRQGETDPWKEMVMTNLEGRLVQGDGTYACVLSADDPVDPVSDGPFEYFYEVGFSGYAPSFPAYRYPQHSSYNHVVNDRFDDFAGWKYLIDTTAWALLSDRAGTNTESRSPAFYPDFAWQYNREKPEIGEFFDYAYDADVVPGSAAEEASEWGFARKFDLRKLDEGWPVAPLNRTVWDEASSQTRVASGTVEIEAEYKYLTLLAKDGVRRFRSFYTDLAAVTEDDPAAARPSKLDRSYPMQHVGDYTWQAIIHVTNAVDARFSVTGAWFAAEGATEYEDGPFEWLQLDQDETAINPPMSGAFTVKVDPDTGDETTNSTQLVRFTTHPEERIEDVSEEVDRTTTNLVSGAGWFVGVVTDPRWSGKSRDQWPTNGAGGVLEPGVGDVAFWHGVLAVEDTWVWDDELGEDVPAKETNIVSDILWNEVVTTNVTWDLQTNEVRTLVPRDTYASYYNWKSRVEVTNVFSSPIVTNAVFEDWKETVHTIVTNVVWEPDWWTVPGSQDAEHRTRVQIDYDGFLMFRFCTTNGSYQIRRAAWQDFNAWQADDRRYSQSFGLYDMKTFESDLAGRATTEFDTEFTTLFLDDLDPTDDWTDGSRGTFWNCIVAKNAKVLRERTRADSEEDEKSTKRNQALVLRAYPKTEGSVETTSVRAEDGRDTLHLQVRSRSDDNRCITYKGSGTATGDANPLNWQNYRVVARILGPNGNQVSDGEHSLSLIGYWQDPYNYWEARITQKSSLTGDAKYPMRNWFEVRVFKWVDGDPEEVQWGTIGQNNQWGHGYTASSTRFPTWPGWNDNRNTGDRNDQSYNNQNADYGLFTTTRDNGWCFVFDLTTDGGSVTPTVWAFRQGHAATWSPTAYNYRYVCPATSGGTTKGRPGFNTRDCGLKIAPYVYVAGSDADAQKMKTWAASTASAFSSVPTSPDSEWDHNNSALYDSRHKADVWKVTKGNNPSLNGSTGGANGPTIVERKPPTVYYRLETCRTGKESTDDFNAPIGQISGSHQAKWDTNWDAFHGHASDIVKEIASWRWTPVDLPMKFWDDTYLNLHACANDGNGHLSLADLAVDTMECAEWRGKQVWDPARDEGTSRAWSATYAAIAAEGREGRRYELNRTRANPSAVQALQTPLLDRGVGDVTFKYEVKDYPVELSVEALVPGGIVEHPPVVLQPTAQGKSESAYFLFATNVPGRIRVVARTPENAPDGHLGTLYVKDVRATDYPATGDTSWQVYNALVSTFPSNVAQRAGLSDRELLKTKFDGISEAARSMRSAVLNDGYAADTLNDVEFDDHVPFLQTPSIETGVGEISFWYRASPDNGGTPAQISLMVADSGSRPDGAGWRKLTVEDLWKGDAKNPNPNYTNQVEAMQALDSVTNRNWRYFNVEFYDQEDRVLRIVAGNGTDMVTGYNRVMLDNVLITEPVRSSIDVGSIEFDPGVPLNTKDTHAKVTLVNPRMNPTDIEVYLDWFLADGDIVPMEVRTEEVNVWTNTTDEPLWYDTITGQVYLDDSHDGEPGVIRGTYPLSTVYTATNVSVDVTRVPLGLRETSRKWGYEKWAEHRSNRISFTNEPGKSYTFLSKTPIPTRGMPADSVIQYCVYVKYNGQFSAPIYSETQGRVKNGFWFDNPPWYEPIDLNTAFGTLEQPSAHFFVFSCTTNSVRVNELRPAAKTTGRMTFVELIGPEGASLEGWRLEHFGQLNGALSTSYVCYTNVMAEGAAFKAANNATTNKGWGFWILGSYGVDPALVDQELFPPDMADLNTGSPMTVPGALRLRRSMGAYADRIAWGLEARVTSFLREGFTWAKNLTSGTRSMILKGAEDENGNPVLAWDNTATFTIGGYNADEEDALPWVDGQKQKERVPALLDPPEILGFEPADANNWRIRFRVRISPESAALGQDVQSGDYKWYVDSNSGLGDWDQFANSDEITDVEILPPADGKWKEFAIEAPHRGAETLFYRIRAEAKK